jgi:hypothetical protein
VKFDLQSIIGIERGSFSEKLNNKKEKEISRFFFSVVKVCLNYYNHDIYLYIEIIKKY